MDQEFFKDLGDEASADGIWFKGIKGNMKRLIDGRNILENKNMDESANELFLKHVRLMGEALGKADSAEAAVRKFAIQTIWRAAGRAGEPSFLSFNDLKWNELFDTPTMTSFQSKPSKLKYVVFVAGRTRHDDWLLDFGDHLCFASRVVGEGAPCM